MPKSPTDAAKTKAKKAAAKNPAQDGKTLRCVEITEYPKKKLPKYFCASMRMLTFSEPVRCAVCGKLDAKMKTMLCDFLAMTVPLDGGEGDNGCDGCGGDFDPKRDGMPLAPLSAVCYYHLCTPHWK